MGMSALEVRRRVMMAQPHEAVASGAVASFRTDVISPLPMEFDLVPIQAGTGDPSPENIRPITGHDGFTRVRTGKNLFDGEVHNMAFVAQSATTANIQGNAYWRSIYARVEGGKTYTISRTTIETNRFRMVATVDEPTVGEDAVILSNSADNDSLYAVTVTIPDGYNYLFVYLSNQGATVTPGNYQIELGSHATTIVPYQGNSYSTTFPTPPGTVYGGHVRDNGDGTYDLTVTRAMVGGSQWEQYNQSNGFKAYRINGVPVPNGASATGMSALSNMIGEFGSFNSSSMTKNIIQPHSPSAPNVYMALQSDVSASDVWFTYLLGTPIVYTLSLDVISSIIGQNNIWVDNADSVTVEYWGH